MPYGSVQLIPGVDVERTPTLLKTGYSQTQLVRWRDGLAQKLGGWDKYYPLTIPGVPRDLHVWEDLDDIQHVLVGTTTQLAVITEGSLSNITPQTLTSDFAPNFSTTMGLMTVTIIDPNIANVTVYDSILFNTPVSVAGIILSGIYPIIEIVGTDSYKITAATAATGTVNNGGAVPVFTTSNGSTLVEVTIDGHNLTTTDSVVFQIPTTGNGVTVTGRYNVVLIVDANNFNIAVSTQATSSGSFDMNSGNAEVVYYIAIGPAAVGAGYGTGDYGAGGYGTGTTSGQQTGNPITATDYTSDNWGEIALACPSGGGVYQFDPTAGFTNGGLVATAPIFNGGIFVSSAQETLVCWATTSPDENALGLQQDPLLVGWSSIGDYTNFQVLATTTAGFQRIQSGSRIVTGIGAPQQDLIITDLDCWAMNFIGGEETFGFVKIGAGAGAISSHAVQQLRGNVYWMGAQNFYAFTSAGLAVLPCPVWDFVFQNLNTAFQENVRALPNTPYNEAGWAFPSNNSVNGENDCYVKFNLLEPNAPWDYGPSGVMPRSAWTDQSIVGPPLGAVPTGVVYQHEVSNDADGQPLVASFTTGYFFIAEGEDLSFVDQILPDFIWGFFGQGQTATIQITINALDYPGDSPDVYGPYPVTQATEYLSVRIRARQMAFFIQSSDIGSFWRLGRIRYRYAPSGRR